MTIFDTTCDVSLLMARDLATPLVAFTELARSQDPKVLKALTENPNTPPEILRGLSQRFPGEFLKNPVLPMLLLESPEFFRRFTLEQLQVLIFRADFPRFVLLDL